MNFCFSSLCLGVKRCEKSLQYIPVAYHHRIPIVNMTGHQLENLGNHLLYIAIPDQTDYFLVSSTLFRSVIEHEVFASEFLKILGNVSWVMAVVIQPWTILNLFYQHHCLSATLLPHYYHIITTLLPHYLPHTSFVL